MRFWGMVLLASSMFAAPVNGLAYCGNKYSSIADQVKDCAIVVAGEVKAKKTYGGPDDIQVFGYQLHVLRTYKGEPGQDIEIVTEDSSGRYPLAVGESYLLFVEQRSKREFEPFKDSKPGDKVFVITNCQNNSPLESAGPVCDELGRLSDEEFAASYVPKKDGKDAPKCAWWSADWNVDKDRFEDIEKKFGPALKWSNGDAICGEENDGYLWEKGKDKYWVVFFRGELGTGIRVSDDKSLAVTLGFADTCERPDPAGRILPEGPFPALNGTLEIPIPIGEDQADVLAKLGTPSSRTTTAGGIEMMDYSWDCRECRYNFPHVGDLDGVQTSLTVGFREKKLVHYEFSRAWGL